MLKSLELFGFKSFADRSTFEFARGITGVVGPNGSGKSNVVDAIKWILGDQSAKSLRAGEMTDVIFNGAAGRKPSSFAEATLTFDNSSGFLPTEMQEVQVGRRIWRSGDAEYLINRAPARLKDVRELFMGTGAGASAYCIIEQGRVDQILQASATSRRLVFEEAAGISRYKARKTDALRKLERVDQNLLRLTDIVDEVEARLNALRSQASKAAKFREVSEELRTLWLGLAADDYRHLSGRLEQAERQTAALAAQTDELNSQQCELEGRLTSLDPEIAQVEDRLRDVERHCAANREDIARREATVRHQTARQRELESELIRLRTQRAMMEGRVREIVDEHRHHVGVLDRFEDEFGRRKDELMRCEIQILQLSATIESDRKRIEQDRQLLVELTHQTSSLGNRAAGLQSQLESAASDKQATGHRRDKLDKQIAACRAECDRWQTLVAEATSQAAAAEEKASRIQDRRQTLARQRNQFQRTLSELREQRSALQARQSVLFDLERRQEGFGIGVKEILRRAETSDYPPWNRILGSVADLITVELEQAALLDVALGSRAQLIVLEEYQPLIDYLNGKTSQISGRVGFVALPNGDAFRAASSEKDESQDGSHSARNFNHFRIDPLALPDLSQQPGVVTRADRLMHCSKRVPWLGEQLLADTWVVETLDVALELSTGAGRTCRFVTLQGELLSPDGTLYVGTVQTETAVVSRKSELRRLKNDLLRLDHQTLKQEEHLSALSDSLTHSDTELEEAESELQESSDRRVRLESEVAAAERELARLQRDREAANAELSRIDRLEASLGSELQDTQMELARTDEDRRNLQTSIDASVREVSRIEHRLQTLERKRIAGRLDLAKQEERLNSLRTSHGRFERELSLRLQQRDEAVRRFELAASKLGQITLHILNTNAVLAELFLSEEASSGNAAALVDQKDELRRQREKFTQKEAGIRQQRRELNELGHREEIKARDIRHQITTLQQRIEEEYQLELTEVARSDASAVRLYLQELDEPNFEDVRDQIEANVNRLRRKLKLMGHVNTDSLQDLDDLENRFGHLNSQLQDLVEAKSALEEIVRRINAESQRLFAETFESIRGHFGELFRKLFGGGEGNIVLEDPEDILECGIDVVARPPGKEFRSISLLSGGEKTMTAIALLLAIFKSRPSPFCILDEVDASLDEANVDRFVGVLTEFQHATQFIIVTHRKPSMTVADVLYGVTMEQSGVSKRMSVRFEDVSENGGFITGSGDQFDPPSTGEMNDAA